MTFTAFCQSNSGLGTIWIQDVEADDVTGAIAVAQQECADAWEYEPEQIHVLGIAESPVKILHWDVNG